MNKLSNSEKNKICDIFKLLIIQILYICLVANIFCNSIPVSQSEIRQASLTVEETHLLRIGSEYKFVIEADSDMYFFDGRPVTYEYSNTQLNETISTGDYLEISYVKKNFFNYNYNLVIAAQSNDIIFRTTQGYYEGKQGIGIGICVIALVFEIVQITFFLMLNSDLLNAKELKRIIRKLTKE